MDGSQETVQVMQIAVEGIRFGVELTIQALKAATNLAVLIKKAIRNGQEERLINAKGEVSFKKMMKLDPNAQFMKIEPELKDYFITECKRHGIPVTMLPSLDDTGKAVHYFFPSVASPRMASVLEFVKEESVRRQMKLNTNQSQEEAARIAGERNCIETPEEYMKATGALCPPSEFKEKFLKKYPEERNMFKKKLEQTDSIEEIRNALITNKIENGNVSGNLSENEISMNFKRSQVVGKERIDNELYVKVKAEGLNDTVMYLKASNIVKLKGDNFAVILKKDDIIKTTDLNGSNIRSYSVNQIINGKMEAATSTKKIEGNAPKLPNNKRHMKR